MSTTESIRPQVSECHRLRTEVTSPPASGHAVLSVAGELDLAEVQTLRTAVARCLDERPGRHLVLDVSALAFCDCSGMHALRWTARQARAAGGDFSLRGADETLCRLFSLTGAYELLAAAGATVEAAFAEAS
ncbi:MAG TPA: STAS domain-containing protein [Actinospica sp.]|jgi:anti-anti-sigma factor|nr:STAS domain-containing protein [Actinospica sp.]